MTWGGNASDKQGILSPAKPGDETISGEREDDTPGDVSQVLERVLERSNLLRALHKVTRNKGGPGIDGMTVDELPGHLKEHWPHIKAELLSGKYKLQPVKRVEIPKSRGGVRKLGVPTVTDQLIQQALIQVLQEQWDSTFSHSSFGFRPKRSAHLAVACAQGYLAKVYDWVVDIDLEKFFDQVDHDTLIHRVTQRVRRLTRRTRGKKIRQIIGELMVYLIGWKGYFCFAEALSPLRDLDKWIRRRLRCYMWKQWGRRIYKELREGGVSRMLAWNTVKSAHGPLRISQSPALSFALPEKSFRDLGLLPLVA